MKLSEVAIEITGRDNRPFCFCRYRCKVVQIALNLLEGAAVITRAGQLRSFGLPISTASFQFRPRLLS